MSAWLALPAPALSLIVRRRPSGSMERPRPAAGARPGTADAVAFVRGRAWPRIAGRVLAALILATGVIGPAAAAVLDGVSLPDSAVVAGRPLVLNGIGLRTYSILGIRIYVAGLYLQQRSSDPASILRSPEVKLLDVRFLRDVGASDARRSWREGLQDNCPRPCRLPPQEIERFLAAVPSVRRGDTSTLLFTPGRLDFTFNGRPYGTITDPLFVQVVLATFIGPEPSSPGLKRALLGGGTG